MKRDALEKLRRAGHAQKHRDQVFQPGHWVFVWRRMPQGRYVPKGGIERSRWCGPGVVVAQDKHTIWVGMRRKLWKCNADQVRAATTPESMGAEVLQREHLSELLSEARKRWTQG